MITATNMFADMQTIGEVIQGIHHLLKDGGVFVAETHYLLDVIQGGQFDTDLSRTFTYLFVGFVDKIV